MEERLDAKVLKSWPAVDEARLDALLQEEIQKTPLRFAVLDDDPTGVQTVHGISVYTDWSEESMGQGFAECGKVFYVLTNSRGMTGEQSEKIHREIAQNAVRAAAKTETPFLFISRSDSTLRGHYPLETGILKEELEKREGVVIHGEILCPFFKEGGRFTLNDVHYVQEGEQLVPAAETEFARDKTFGYSHSNLREYVEEKTKGAFRAADVCSISLEELRNPDFDKLTEKLCALENFQKLIVNAVDYCDVKTFAIALYRAMGRGRRFLFRTAAGFVKVVGGIADKPLLTAREMGNEKSPYGGMVVVGSHTLKTTRQLQALLELEEVVGIPFHSNLVMQGDEVFKEEIARVVKQAAEVIQNAGTAVCYTDRKLLSVEGESKEEALLRSVKISDGVQSLVGRLPVTPAFVVAKGGITSSDIGTKALGVKRALVLGQVKPGIPVWQTGAESRFPGIPYVIFPGNVGSDETLMEVVKVFYER